MNTSIESSSNLDRHGSASGCEPGERAALVSMPADRRVVSPAGPLPQLIAMCDVIAWWTRENWLARGGR